MNVARPLKALLVVGVVAALCCGLAACSNNPSGGVAATVNGVEIPEQKVTDQIEHVRAQSGLSDDDQWGKFLVQNDMTPESVRSTIIDTLVEQELIKSGAKDLGVEVNSSEVEEAIDNFKKNYSSDDAWKDALKQAGFTEDTYYSTIEQSMIEKKVGEHFEGQVQTTDADNVQSAQTYASYYNGAKHVSKILFGVEDSSNEEALAAAQAQAADVAARVKAGTLDFAEAARQYSTDEASKANGGDIGWDKLESFDEDIVNALTDLNAGDVSDPKTGNGGVFILKVTEVYNAPEDASTITSLDQIPPAFQTNIKEMAVSVKANSLYTEWLDNLKNNANKVVNDMPSGLPYAIDLSKYSSEAASASSAAADATTADAGAATTTDTGATAATDTGAAAATGANAAGTTATTAQDATATTAGSATATTTNGASASAASATSASSGSAAPAN